MNWNVFDSFPELQSERLQLKMLLEPNLDHMLEITSFNNRATTKQQVQKLLHELEVQFKNRYMITWGMYFEDELVGTIGFYRGFEGEIGEVGYVVREKFRRQGFMQEAMRQILNFGFQEMDLTMITAYTKDDNLPSIRMLEKYNFKATEEFSDEYRRYELPAKRFV